MWFNGRVHTMSEDQNDTKRGKIATILHYAMQVKRPMTLFAYTVIGGVRVNADDVLCSSRRHDYRCRHRRLRTDPTYGCSDHLYLQVGEGSRQDPA